MKCSYIHHIFALSFPPPPGISDEEYVREFHNQDTPHEFDDWFTWCQTCRHGGHAGHVQDWFASHEECPVAECTCKCSSLDALD
jgi:hypothetical protein